MPFFTQITYSHLTFIRMSITKIPSNLMINYQLIEMQKTSSHLHSDPTVARRKLQQQQRTTQHFLTSPQTFLAFFGQLSLSLSLSLSLFPPVSPFVAQFLFRFSLTRWLVIVTSTNWLVIVVNFRKLIEKTLWEIGKGYESFFILILLCGYYIFLLWMWLLYLLL